MEEPWNGRKLWLNMSYALLGSICFLGWKMLLQKIKISFFTSN